jgi:hypothetical protein
MENQPLDPVASRTVEKLLGVFLDCSSLIGFVMTLATLINSSNILIHVLFLTSITVVHAISTIPLVCPRYEVEAGLMKRLLICPDVHYLTILVIFLFNGSCPFLYVILYGYFFAARTATCAVDRLHLGSASAQEAVGRLVRGPVFVSIPSYVEIVLCLELAWNAIIQFTVIAWFTLFAYIFWLLAFNFASSEIHARVWATVSLWMRKVAAGHAETFGPLIEKVVDAVGEFGAAAAKMYPGKELKVHLK